MPSGFNSLARLCTYISEARTMGNGDVEVVNRSQIVQMECERHCCTHNDASHI